MPSTQPNPKIQTFLAHAGIASRRKSEELVSQGKVSINGAVAKIGQRVDPVKDEVTLNGKSITQKDEIVTYLINKPPGIVSTTSDELGRQTVVEFLKAHLPAGTSLPRLYPVGRLDMDSEGLMILTNDGDFAQHFTHPSYEVEKTYRVTVLGRPTAKALAHLARGVRLREGITAPAQVRVIENDDPADTNDDVDENLNDERYDETSKTTLEITIHEGRNHQVKRMLLRVGYEVTRLVRVKMGEYTLEQLGKRKVQKIS